MSRWRSRFRGKTGKGPTHSTTLGDGARYCWSTCLTVACNYVTYTIFSLQLQADMQNCCCKLMNHSSALPQTWIKQALHRAPSCHIITGFPVLYYTLLWVGVNRSLPTIMGKEVIISCRVHAIRMTSFLILWNKFNTNKSLNKDYGMVGR